MCNGTARARPLRISPSFAGGHGLCLWRNAKRVASERFRPTGVQEGATGSARGAPLGQPVEILTVDNHVDGVYLYMKLLREDPERAEITRRLLAWNGGGANSSGVGIANIDAEGFVHPDQFWQTHTLGNVRERSFSEIWTDSREPLLTALRDRLPRLSGRCSSCRWKPLCGGSFRVRALQATGDPWAPDPACYLSDEEIAS